MPFDGGRSTRIRSTAGAPWKTQHLESQPLQTLQVSENQFRQVVAVTALQNTECGDAQLADRLAEPVVVLRFERLLGERVTRVGIESRGNGDQLRLELFQSVQRFRQ